MITQYGKKNARPGGYLTAEASLLLPLIVFLYVFIIYLSFYLYDRCLLCQDLYLLCMEGSPKREMSVQERQERMENEAPEIFGQKYLAMKHADREITVTGSSIRISGRGSLKAPSGVVGIIPDKNWEFMISANARITDPVKSLRRFKKLREALQSLG